LKRLEVIFSRRAESELDQIESRIGSDNPKQQLMCAEQL